MSSEGRSLHPSKSKSKSDHNSNNNNDNRQTGKGLLELFIFAAALATGTASSILSKVMYAATTVDESTGQQLHFDKPIAQTFYMFVAMLLGLPIHWLVVACRIPFPGYIHDNNQENDVENDHAEVTGKLAAKGKGPTSPVALVEPENSHDAPTPRMQSHRHTPQTSTKNGGGSGERASLLPTYYRRYDIDKDDFSDTEPDYGYATIPAISLGTGSIPWKTYMQLVIPAFFDCTSTALFMVGLLFLDVSVYQLLRGSGIIFVGLLRQYGLKEHLYQYQWVGLWWNVVSALLVGATAFLDSKNANNNNNNVDVDVSSNTKSAGAAAIGVVFMMAGTLFQAIEFVLEEKFMVADEIKVPPLLFFGMKGFWGVALTLVFLYPIAYYIPGNDNGSFESFWTGCEMVRASTYIQALVIIYCLVIFGFNLFCVLVTFLRSSIWHAVLNIFRPLTVWGTDLFLFYALRATGDLGEAWTPCSWLQLIGMVVLIYGTAVYNAPDSGSIRLKGEWYSLGMDFSHEYKEIDSEQEAQRRFSLGSYPSLQGFLKVSGGGTFGRSLDDTMIRFGRRVKTLPHRIPTIYAISVNNNYYNDSIGMKVDRSQHSI